MVAFMTLHVTFNFFFSTLSNNTAHPPLWHADTNFHDWIHIAGLVKDCYISIALVVEIVQSCTKPSVCSQISPRIFLLYSSQIFICPLYLCRWCPTHVHRPWRGMAEIQARAFQGADRVWGQEPHHGAVWDVSWSALHHGCGGREPTGARHEVCGGCRGTALWGPGQHQER